MDDRLRQLAIEVVVREARLLDERAWDDWLALYDEQAVFRVPAWRDEDELTQDPERELSLMHLRGRAMLAERVARIRSGLSAASKPLPRTNHLVTGFLVSGDEGAGALVRSAWTTHAWLHKDAELVTYTGRYEHALHWTGGAWRIRRKTVVLVNDRLASPVDVFHL